jgi:hypothetical protein
MYVKDDKEYDNKYKCKNIEYYFNHRKQDI